MAFRRKNPIGSKIIINNQPIEQVSHFNFLEFDVTYEYEHNINKKINRFQMICGSINRKE